MLKNTKHREKCFAYGSEDNIKMVIPFKLIFKQSEFQSAFLVEIYGFI